MRRDVGLTLSFLGLMMRSPFLHADVAPGRVSAQTPFEKEAEKRSPSFDKNKWTGTQMSYESVLEADYVGGASQNFGNGNNGPLNGTDLYLNHQFVRHTLLAFLIDGGVEYQHRQWDVPHDALIPERLDSLNADAGIDFRWSQKDLLHLLVRPGLYTEWEGGGSRSFNAPVDIGYTRVTSRDVQWVVGMSVNGWRSTPVLGAAGIRWRINSRWKIKAYLPTPEVEYVARPNLTLMAGADIRGDTYRVGPHFGDDRGHPELNNALVDYQEVRVGPGLSWNILPLLELNMRTGYMVGRTFDFHNNGVRMNGSGSPYILVQLHWLMKGAGEPLAIPQRNRVSLHDILNYF